MIMLANSSLNKMLDRVVIANIFSIARLPLASTPQTYKMLLNYQTSNKEYANLYTRMTII